MTCERKCRPGDNHGITHSFKLWIFKYKHLLSYFVLFTSLAPY